jgi:hypothetical protein
MNIYKNAFGALAGALLCSIPVDVLADPPLVRTAVVQTEDAWLRRFPVIEVAPASADREVRFKPRLFLLGRPAWLAVTA